MYINNKPIAILLAAYNAELYLKEQVDSLLTQTNQDWTVYIRNDGSTDSTSEIIEKYCLLYSEKIIEIEKKSKNLGCRNNFFKLLDIVESQYYMFCDADDVWLPEKVELSLKTIIEKEKLYPDKPILVHSDAMICDESLQLIEPSFWKATGINPDKFTTYNYVAICCTVGGAKSIFNKKAKETVFPLAENNLMFDYWLALNVAKKGYIFPMQEPLILYRQHDNQICGVAKRHENSIKYKLSRMGQLFKKYNDEARVLKSIGYGSRAKYFWYKLMTVIKIRILK